MVDLRRETGERLPVFGTSETVRLLLVIGAGLLGLVAAAHALLNRTDSRSALGWVFVCLWVPVFGPLLYLAAGFNRVSRRARRLFPRTLATQLPAPPSGLPAPVGMELLEPAGRALSGLHLAPNNDVVPLADGDEAYPRMIAAIEGARNTVWLSTYIFDSSETGRTFVQALADATKRGVDVRVLIDGFGERITRGPRASRLLLANGVNAKRFLPLRLFPPNPLINLRNHRKLLWIDGSVAFVGGMNIGERHLRAGLADRTAGTADIHFEVRGPVVQQLASAFIKDWKLATKQLLEAPAENEAAGSMYARCITDGPDDDLDKLPLVYAAAIAAAQSSVRIMTPYFIPPESIRVALQAAAIRGVQVDVVLPERSNIRVVDWASRVHQRDLVRRSVRVWLAPAPFNHGKLLVVDDRFSLIGSANLDPRSLSLNFELGLEVYDDGLGTALAQHIEGIRSSAHRVTSAELESRPFLVRLRDALAWLASPYL